MTRTIRQKTVIHASPRAVYDTLLDSRKHAAFTGDAARISRKIGGSFSCYGGYIDGINLELVPARRIVQAWKSRGWPEGTYSLVTFSLAKAPGGGTRLTFVQVGVPASDFNAKSEGWKTHYWKPLKAYLE